MTPVISVSGLGKRYRIGGLRRRADTFRDTLAGLAGGAWRGARSIFAGGAPGGGTEEFWALKDVSFEVAQGEVVGIIGRNGAGKSTLLKILSRITEPTEGEAVLRGRLGSLLEVGTGFHPELTGRENIYLSGAVLGMRKAEIAAKFEEIVEFSGVEKFLDTPCKRYSSGMYVRLGFAVAAHLDPEILLVDEVLAVGDAEFQKKCLGKMSEVARGGRTVLFVSHNMAAVSALCSRGVVLNAGCVVREGAAERCVNYYMGQSTSLAAAGRLEEFRRDRLAAGCPVFFSRLILNGVQLPTEHPPVISCGDDIEIEMGFESRRSVRGANLTLVLSRLQGDRAVVVFSGDKDFSLDLDPPGGHCRCRLGALPLTPGIYKLDVGINSSTVTTALDAIVDLPAFSVESVPQTHGRFPHRPWGTVHWDQVTWSKGGS
jgi:lipopolysaccharide transport system ATP-binding protein